MRTAPRLFVISTQPQAGIYAAVYQSAVDDLKSGYDVALVVETRPMFAASWARTLAAMQNGGVPISGAFARACLPPTHAERLTAWH